MGFFNAIGKRNISNPPFREKTHQPPNPTKIPRPNPHDPHAHLLPKTHLNHKRPHHLHQRKPPSSPLHLPLLPPQTPLHPSPPTTLRPPHPQRQHRIPPRRIKTHIQFPPHRKRKTPRQTSKSRTRQCRSTMLKSKTGGYPTE